MYKLRAWYKDNGTPVRYIIEGDSISQLWELFIIDVDLTDVLEVSISGNI